MREFIQKLSGKEITFIITSAGGILLAGALIYYFMQFAQATKAADSEEISQTTQALVQVSVALNEVSSAVKGVSENQKEQTEVLRGVKESQQELKVFLQTIFNRK